MLGALVGIYFLYCSVDPRMAANVISAWICIIPACIFFAGGLYSLLCFCFRKVTVDEEGFVFQLAFRRSYYYGWDQTRLTAVWGRGPFSVKFYADGKKYVFGQYDSNFWQMLEYIQETAHVEIEGFPELTEEEMEKRTLSRRKFRQEADSGKYVRRSGKCWLNFLITAAMYTAAIFLFAFMNSPGLHAGVRAGEAALFLIVLVIGSWSLMSFGNLSVYIDEEKVIYSNILGVRRSWPLSELKFTAGQGPWTEFRIRTPDRIIKVRRYYRREGGMDLSKLFVSDI